MDDNAMDTSNLVNYLINRAIERCYITPIYYAAKRAKTFKDLKPITFKQALNYPQKYYWLPAFFKEL